MNYKKFENLLINSKEIVKKHNQTIREKGEDFNVFSILGMETNETKTHSAMLVALLNPTQNHYHDEKFLELFLQEIGYDYESENLKLVVVKTEHHLGKISEDYESGGFIDILITFPSGKTIVIENKVDAKDQYNQLYRYSLFNRGKSSLYYLNQYGDQPSCESLNGLADEDYEIITYNNEIIKWLEKCLSIVSSGTIIEASIKQYQILLKKITNTMNDHLQREFNNLIIKNLEEAKYIHSYYQSAVNNVRENLRNAVCEKLNSMKLPVKATLGRDIKHTYSKIWLRSDALQDLGIQFGIEPFSGKGNTDGEMFVGILDRQREYDVVVDGDRRLNSYWPIIRCLRTTENKPFNLSSTDVLENLSSDTDYFDAAVNSIAEQTRKFIESYYSYCLQIANSSALKASGKSVDGILKEG